MQKQYELEQWYPSLPKGFKVGDKVVRFEGDCRYVSCNEQVPMSISKSEIENNPDFWKKVEQIKYEIMSIEYTGDNKIIPQILYDKQDIEAYLRGYGKEIWKVRSVQRLSDGETFVLGNKVKSTKSNAKGIIKSFELTNNNCWLNCNELEEDIIYLLNASKCKALFTTEHGDKIYEGDEYYSVTKGAYTISKHSHAQKMDSGKSPNQFFYFKTREEADQCKEDYQLVYTKKDIKDALKNSLFHISSAKLVIDVDHVRKALNL